MTVESHHKDAYHHGDLRQALICRAIKVIELNGLEAVTLRALARDIGVSHTAPLRHFSSRSALLAAIAKQGISNLLESAKSRVDEDGMTSLEKLRAMAEGYVLWAAENPAEHLLIRNQDIMRHAEEELFEQARAYAQFHMDIIRHAQKEGWRNTVAATDVFLEITAFTVGLAMVCSATLYKSVFEKPLDHDQLGKALDRFFAKQI